MPDLRVTGVLIFAFFLLIVGSISLYRLSEWWRKRPKIPFPNYTGLVRPG